MLTFKTFSQSYLSFNSKINQIKFLSNKQIKLCNSIMKNFKSTGFLLYLDLP